MSPNDPRHHRTGIDPDPQRLPVPIELVGGEVVADPGPSGVDRGVHLAFAVHVVGRWRAARFQFVGLALFVDLGSRATRRALSNSVSSLISCSADTPGGVPRRPTRLLRVLGVLAVSSQEI